MYVNKKCYFCREYMTTFDIHTDRERKFRVLMVCLGNICRSPAAHHVMEHLIAQRRLSDVIEVDSAGTYGGHAGDLPDPRMRRAASKRGYHLTHRARRVSHADFAEFDLIVGMDGGNANQRDGSFGLPLAYVWCAYGMQTKSHYVCSGNVVWGWRWR